MLVTGISRQSLEWIAAAFGRLDHLPAAHRAAGGVAAHSHRRCSRGTGRVQTVCQSLYVDLSDDPDDPPEPIHLGFRGGRNVVFRFLDGFRAVGVHHVILNFKYGLRERGRDSRRDRPGDPAQHRSHPTADEAGTHRIVEEPNEPADAGVTVRPSGASINRQGSWAMSNSGTTKKTMCAWAINAYGGPEQMRLMDLPVPEPGPRDVLIRMHGAEVGDWDILVREGAWPMERPFPLVLGLAGSGRVAALGPEVAGFAEGEPVYVYSYPLYHNGAWAEYMLVPASYAARAPAPPRPDAGGRRADRRPDRPRDPDGHPQGASGRRGPDHGRRRRSRPPRRSDRRGPGGRIVATASRRNARFVLALGAETVIDYMSEDLVAAIHSRYPEGVDKASTASKARRPNQVVQALREGGHTVDLTGSVTVRRPGVRVDSDYIVRADAHRLTRLARMIDDRRLTVEIQEVIPFEARRGPRGGRGQAHARQARARDRVDTPLVARHRTSRPLTGFRPRTHPRNPGHGIPDESLEKERRPNHGAFDFCPRRRDSAESGRGAGSVPRPDGRRVSSYYLNLAPREASGQRRMPSARALKKTLRAKRIEQMDVTHEVRQALLRDCELVEEAAPTVVSDATRRPGLLRRVR